MLVHARTATQLPSESPAWHAGDLLTALLMAWMDKHPSNLKAAVEKAVAGLQGVLQATAEAAGDAASAKERDSKVHTASLVLQMRLSGCSVHQDQSLHVCTCSSAA